MSVWMISLNVFQIVADPVLFSSIGGFAVKIWKSKSLVFALFDCILKWRLERGEISTGLQSWLRLQLLDDIDHVSNMIGCKRCVGSGYSVLIAFQLVSTSFAKLIFLYLDNR